MNSLGGSWTVLAVYEQLSWRFMNSLGSLWTVLVGCTAFCNVMDGSQVSVLTIETGRGCVCGPSVECGYTLRAEEQGQWLVSVLSVYVNIVFSIILFLPSFLCVVILFFAVYFAQHLFVFLGFVSWYIPQSALSSDFVTRFSLRLGCHNDCLIVCTKVDNWIIIIIMKSKDGEILFSHINEWMHRTKSE